MIARFVVLAVALLLAAPLPAAAMPSTMPFQGILTNAAGEPIAAGTPVTFALRDGLAARCGRRSTWWRRWTASSA